jgi:hypothetical protein
MKTARGLLLGMAGVLAGVGWAASAAHAQDTPAKGGDDKSKISSGVLGAGDARQLRHGMHIQVTPKGGKTISGTLVRAEGDNLYIRTRPGAAPVKVKVSDRSDVIPAGNEKEVQPEIHEVEIIEGDSKRTTYVGPNLSPGERARLQEIESAEAAVARAQGMASLRQEFLRDERDIEARRAEAQRLFYNYSALTSLGFYPATVITFPEYQYRQPVSSPYFLGPLGAAPYYPLGGISAVAWGGGYRTVPGFDTLPAVSPAAAAGPPDVVKTAMVEAAAKDAGPEALAEARAHLAQLRSHAVYEDGHIVAVKMDGQGEAADYKAGDRVTVTMKGGKAISGTVLRSDGTRLVLRTQANAPPATLLWSNIEAVEPGGVRPAVKDE